MESIYRKSFVFQAERFEEYQNGKCTNQGDINTEIVAEVVLAGLDEFIVFNLRNNRPIGINFHFELPVLGTQAGDILADRIQYGRLPVSLTWSDSNEPLVCNIFNDMKCIRFGMCSPLRIIEFYGSFNKISSTSAQSKPTKEQIKSLIETISEVQSNFSKVAQAIGDTARCSQINEILETYKLPLYFAWRGYKYGWHTDFCKEGDSLFPFLLFEADLKKNTAELITILQTNSPFAQIEKKSAITNSLISVYTRLLNDLDNGTIEI